jgi:hypothetical protein
MKQKAIETKIIVKKRVHELKLLTEYFLNVSSGEKNFEIRFNDRDYRVGDVLILKEFDKEIGLTGRYVYREITYIIDHPDYVKEGFIVMGMKNLEVR